jgi:hypothetical protein
LIRQAMEKAAAKNMLKLSMSAQTVREQADKKIEAAHKRVQKAHELRDQLKHEAEEAEKEAKKAHLKAKRAKKVCINTKKTSNFSSRKNLTNFLICF